MTPEEKAELRRLSEEDIKLRYITPAIVAKGWATSQITMETRVYLTDGKINIMGNMVARGPKKRADYVLYHNSSTPIAIVEAKDAKHGISHGLQQAMEYANMMDVKRVQVLKIEKGRNLTFTTVSRVFRAMGVAVSFDVAGLGKVALWRSPFPQQWDIPKPRRQCMVLNK